VDDAYSESRWISTMIIVQMGSYLCGGANHDNFAGRI
jgi:hypothetical protein